MSAWRHWHHSNSSKKFTHRLEETLMRLKPRLPMPYQQRQLIASDQVLWQNETDRRPTELGLNNSAKKFDIEIQKNTEGERQFFITLGIYFIYFTFQLHSWGLNNILRGTILDQIVPCCDSVNKSKLRTEKSYRNISNEVKWASRITAFCLRL